ncbi:hypothetical protein Tsubulata_010946, partial [Turnera subulata]
MAVKTITKMAPMVAGLLDGKARWWMDFVLELKLLMWISILSYGSDLLEHMVFRIEACIIRFKYPLSSVTFPNLKFSG